MQKTFLLLYQSPFSAKNRRIRNFALIHPWHISAWDISEKVVIGLLVDLTRKGIGGSMKRLQKRISAKKEICLKNGDKAAAKLTKKFLLKLKEKIGGKTSLKG